MTLYGKDKRILMWGHRSVFPAGPVEEFRVAARLPDQPGKGVPEGRTADSGVQSGRAAAEETGSQNRPLTNQELVGVGAARLLNPSKKRPIDG